MARLVVAPMATKYLFWKKLQSVAQLKQRWGRGSFFFKFWGGGRVAAPLNDAA